MSQGRAAHVLELVPTSSARLSRDRCLGDVAKGKVKDTVWCSLAKLRIGANSDEVAKFMQAFKDPQDRRTFEAIIKRQTALEGVENDRVQRFSQYDLPQLELMERTGGGSLYKEEGDDAYVKGLIHELKSKEAKKLRALEAHNKMIGQMELADLNQALTMGLFQQQWEIQAVRSRIDALEAEESSKAPAAAAETAHPMPAGAFMRAPRAITPAAYGRDPADVGGPPPFFSPPLPSSSSAMAASRAAPRTWAPTGSAVRPAYVSSGCGAMYWGWWAWCSPRLPLRFVGCA
jgi:hypothetical protein